MPRILGASDSPVLRWRTNHDFDDAARINWTVLRCAPPCVFIEGLDEDGAIIPCRDAQAIEGARRKSRGETAAYASSPFGLSNWSRYGKTRPLMKARASLTRSRNGNRLSGFTGCLRNMAFTSA